VFRCQGVIAGLTLENAVARRPLLPLGRPPCPPKITRPNRQSGHRLEQVSARGVPAGSRSWARQSRKAEGLNSTGKILLKSWSSHIHMEESAAVCVGNTRIMGQNSRSFRGIIPGSCAVQPFRRTRVMAYNWRGNLARFPARPGLTRWGA
jgi:hypothetical protein